ncbi:hypothetical protein KA062_01700 [Patescibacteria group bacterium]|nr:hypothetical protein [Patescibacteria group bacterium]
MDDNKKLPVDLSSNTTGLSDDKSLKDVSGANLSDDVIGNTDLDGEVAKEDTITETQPIVENVSVGGPSGTSSEEVSFTEEMDSGSVVTSPDKSVEISSDIDVSKEVLTDDADDTESFLDDTENI